MISDKNSSEKSVAVGLSTIIAAALLLSIGVSDTALNNSNTSYQAEAQQQGLQSNNNTVRVEAGGGNSTAPLTVYVPQTINIKAGQSVNWYNPTPVGEPHSVTFLQDNSLFPPFAAPFAVPNSTELTALMPGPNVEPL